MLRPQTGLAPMERLPQARRAGSTAIICHVLAGHPAKSLLCSNADAWLLDKRLLLASAPQSGQHVMPPLPPNGAKFGTLQRDRGDHLQFTQTTEKQIVTYQATLVDLQSTYWSTYMRANLGVPDRMTAEQR